MFLFDVTPASRLAGKVDELTNLIKNAQSLVVVLIAFVATGATGIIAAWRKIRQQIQQVDLSVAPIRHEVSDDDPSAVSEGTRTLRKQVNDIKSDVEDLQKTRAEEHAENTDRLDAIEKQVAEIPELKADLQEVKEDLRDMKGTQSKLGDDVREVRGLVLQVLKKVAGV